MLGGLKEQTGRNYLIRIFDKLGISSRVDLVRESQCTNANENSEDGAPTAHEFQA